uniref:uncharacterized protein LOC117165383 n=1 Tax=Bombus vancouverensis nearcticus TaxID=2705178 RepID=UPI001438DB23|nr:uncharacterized protein LOC117165383 [Bombus vancouverensis nearcticus]XP_033204713.1 uncharacterized protein LOC117165425 [Bombus vancouverensis nearcticus]
MRILQTNLGRSRRAQDLLHQTIRESTVALAVVAEPYRVLDAPAWVGDTDGMVAGTWTSTPGAFAHGALLERGNGYAAVEWAGMMVVGLYVSPNSGRAAFEEFLDGVGDCVRRRLPRQVLVLGDFNAHSTEWGNARTNASGRMLSNWAAGLGLLLVNRGSTSTCVTCRGSSIVDITWASPEAFRRISGWRVAEGVETLSDHLYIFMEVDAPGPGMPTTNDGRGPPRGRHARPPPRWKIKERNEDLLRAAAIATAWSWEASTTTTEADVEEEAENLRQATTAICDASMPRATPGTVRSGAVYWWNPDIAELRTRCVRARRHRVGSMGKAIQDGDTETTREGPPDNDGDGTCAADADHRNALSPTRKQSGGTATGNDTTAGMEGRLGSHGGGDMGGYQKNDFSQRGTGPGRNPWPDLGGSDGGHGPQTPAPLHKMPEGGSLPPGVADDETGPAP